MKCTLAVIVIAAVLSQGNGFVTNVLNVANKVAKVSQTATDFGRQATAAGQKNVNNGIQTAMNAENKVLDFASGLTSGIPIVGDVVNAATNTKKTVVNTVGETVQGYVNTKAKVADNIMASGNKAVQGTVGALALASLAGPAVGLLG